MARNAGVPSRVSANVARRAFNLRFVGETISELRRVTWPNREETTRLTIMVIAVAVTIGIFLGLVDLVFSRIFDVVLR
jgi:preprotein translocase subunit SecE